MSQGSRIGAALVAAKKQVGAVGKDEKNTHFNFNFRGIDAVLNACHHALVDNGLIVAPIDVDYTLEAGTSGKHNTLTWKATVKVTYKWVHTSGEAFNVVVIGEANDLQDKALSKAMSVALRTCILQTLTLPTDEIDPDAEAYDMTPGFPGQQQFQQQGQFQVSAPAPQQQAAQPGPYQQAAVQEQPPVAAPQPAAEQAAPAGPSPFQEAEFAARFQEAQGNAAGLAALLKEVEQRGPEQALTATRAALHAASTTPEETP